MINQYPYVNPYLAPNINMSPMQQNVLPPQQILQCMGMDSANSIKMSPNSSALIADTNLPIIYKCISDSLGNTQVQAFDVTPHKDEEQIQKDNVYEMISDLRVRIERLEHESSASRNAAKLNYTESHANEEITSNDEVHVES